jgi:hypothetical protein
MTAEQVRRWAVVIEVPDDLTRAEFDLMRFADSLDIRDDIKIVEVRDDR